MSQIQYRLLVIVCVIASLLGTAEAMRMYTDSASAGAAHSQSRKLRQRSAPVTEWFRKYDQIRRDAEMTTGDKLQSLLLASAKPDKKNAALASRMMTKYAAAICEMKKLQPVPETRNLQQGYIAYFSTAHQLFANYLDAQKIVPFTNKSLTPAKKKLEALDKTNKKLDAELRKQYVISKHKHS